MKKSTWNALRAISPQIQGSRSSLRAGQHIAQSRRSFQSLPARRRDESVANSSATELPLQIESPAIQSVGSPDSPPEIPPKPRDHRTYGSATKRASRQSRRRTEAKVKPLPQWFSQRNVSLYEDIAQGEVLEEDHSASPTQDPHLPTDSPVAPDQPRNLPGTTQSSSISLPDPSLLVDRDIDAEIQALLRSSLSSISKLDTHDSRPHLMLQCPIEKTTALLKTYVKHVASLNKLDIVTVSPSDIAELVEDYAGQGPQAVDPSLGNLGYDVAAAESIKRSTSGEAQEQEESEDAEEEDDAEDDAASQRPLTSRHPSSGPQVGFVPTFVASFKLDDIFKSLNKIPNMPGDVSSSSKLPDGKTVLEQKRPNYDEKVAALIDGMIRAPELKRISVKEPSSSADVECEEEEQHAQLSRGLVLLIEDYAQIDAITSGETFLETVHEIVRQRRTDGQPLLIIGISSSSHVLPHGNSKSSVSSAQSNNFGGCMRTIVVPVNGVDEWVLEAEEKQRIRDVNLRHLRIMLKSMSADPMKLAQITSDWDILIESKYAFISGLEASIWPRDRVNRVASVAMGLLGEDEQMTTQTIEQALALLDASDEAKFKAVSTESVSQADKRPATIITERTKEDVDIMMKKLRKKCNAHEKKLLNGVINPSSIQTTFADIRAPPATIDSLKTLTSLSLKRPDAFSYGVLATDRIPGLLLYGPPGTGKTLLAKAVAKESGAHMLEVSGSDVYDMYVGEGEKNVRAIFTLAKKLSPCIVFIDEADAILGTRNSGHGRTSHRELINQFLREWDGMTDMSAFIMVATNRPFDLDEACLRRLPRRLLVDLPVEADREAILRIHLQNEDLDSAISIPTLASQTPFYSGSDLKNLSVAAALACVREELADAERHGAEQPGVPWIYPAKRRLYTRHFDAAMAEISASVSEDTGSLAAIRKFDEKYGDRRGRRKKLGGYGFKTVEETEKMGSDAARVRNQV